MKILTAATCLISIGVLSGCVDDRGYRSGGHYSDRSHYRDYGSNSSGRDYDWRDRRGWRDNDRGGYNGQARIVPGVVVRR